MITKESASSNRRIAGSKAVKRGRIFEDIFYAVCICHKIAITRIPDGCRVVGRGRLLRVRSPFDWFISYQNESAIIDTKTIEGYCFPNSAIDDQQVIQMLRHQNEGTLAGYVIHTRKNNAIFFVPANILRDRTLSGRGSISSDDPGITCLGSFKDFQPKNLFI